MATPSGYTGARAVYQVQQRTGETTLPTATDILTLLNAGLEQSMAVLNPVLLRAAVATTAGQIEVTLPVDVNLVERITWSTADPTTVGAIEYPLQQLERFQFDVFAGGTPGVGLGPPAVYTIVQDASNVIQIALYPSASVGQLNVYYRARPTIWADTGTSVTNVESSVQEAAIVWACWKVAQARGRYQLGQLFQQEYESLVTSYKDRVRRRTVPRSGRVTDVSSLGYPGVPPWLR